MTPADRLAALDIILTALDAGDCDLAAALVRALRHREATT